MNDCSECMQRYFFLELLGISLVVFLSTRAMNKEIGFLEISEMIIIFQIDNRISKSDRF